LRVAEGGGSSKQFVMIINGPKTRMQTIQPPEAARLMGMPENYVLPAKPIEALSATGVVVPAVRFAEHVIEPLLVRNGVRP
jgi:DNA (cytosine-5)-methyltransferase 1